MDVCAAKGHEKAEYKIFFYTLQNIRRKIILCNKTPQSLACMDLDYIFKAVLRILIVKVVLILPLVLK